VDANTDTNGDVSEQNGQDGWGVTRRTLMAGVGAVTGLGALVTPTRAQQAGSAHGSGATFSVYRANPGYRVASAPAGNVEFTERSEDNAERAFQYAFDNLPDGGTVVASADTFQFGGPATLGDGTALVGQDGTRFVASQVGTRETDFPGPDQQNPLAVGHDLIRVRGNDAAVVGVTFDAAGTQLDNHAIQADDCEGLLVADNRTVDGFQMAISFSGCRNVLVRGNEVKNPNWYGITARAAPAGGDLDLKRSSDVVVAGNRVSGMKFNNIATYNVSNFTVVGNLTFDGGHSLIACSPAQQGAIVGNVCRNLEKFGGDPGGEAGIEIEYKETHITDAVADTPEETSFDVTITGNQVENCEVGFIARTVPADPDDEESARREKRPYSFTVTGNSFGGCEDAGIRVRSGESAVIATNTVRDAGTDIDIATEFTEGIQVGLNATRG